MVNSLIVAFGMIIMVAGLIVTTSLPAFFTATHQLLFTLVIVLLGGAIMGVGVKE